MSRRYVISNAAGRDMRRMERTDRERILTALDLLVGEPPRGDVRKLTGRPDEYRLRVGDWRARFVYAIDLSSPMSRPRADRLDEPEITIVVLRVLDRKDAYRN